MELATENPGYELSANTEAGKVKCYFKSPVSPTYRTLVEI
jgi:hypothetical protein